MRLTLGPRSTEGSGGPTANRPDLGARGNRNLSVPAAHLLLSSVIARTVPAAHVFARASQICNQLQIPPFRERPDSHV